MKEVLIFGLVFGIFQLKFHKDIAILKQKKCQKQKFKQFHSNDN